MAPQDSPADTPEMLFAMERLSKWVSRHGVVELRFALDVAGGAIATANDMTVEDLASAQTSANEVVHDLLLAAAEEHLSAWAKAEGPEEGGPDEQECLARWSALADLAGWAQQVGIVEMRPAVALLRLALEPAKPISDEPVTFDPANFTVAQVLDYVEANQGDLDRVIDLERAGKKRATLLAQLAPEEPA